MDLKITIKINKEIMRLIESKFPHSFPPSYPNPDAQYYKRLAEDVTKAERYNSFSDKKD